MSAPRISRYGGGTAMMIVSVACMILGGLLNAHAQTASAAPWSPPVWVHGGAEAIGSGDTILHIVVGRSLSVSSTLRIRRVFVSNPAVVQSFTPTVRELLLTAKSAGTSSVIFWDDSGRKRSYIVSADVDAEGLRATLAELMPEEHIQVNCVEGRIVLSGSVRAEASIETALKAASLYSKDVASSMLAAHRDAKQVRLKVRIVEIDRSKLQQFGINLFGQGAVTGNGTTGQFPSVSALAGAAGSTALAVGDPLNLFLYSTDANVGVAVRDLEQKQVLQVLAEPTITTVSGQKASFISGGEFPYPMVQGGAGGFTSVTIQFRPYGVRLDFTPVVDEQGLIQLRVAPEVSALDYTNAVSISGYSVPALSTRKADTQVEMRDGQSFAISGLLDRRTTEMLNKVPGLGDLPVLGELFRSKSLNRSVVELVVIVTPTVLGPELITAGVPEPKMVRPFIEAGEFDKDHVGGTSKSKVTIR